MGPDAIQDCLMVHRMADSIAVCEMNKAEDADAPICAERVGSPKRHARRPSARGKILHRRFSSRGFLAWTLISALGFIGLGSIGLGSATLAHAAPGGGASDAAPLPKQLPASAVGKDVLTNGKPQLQARLLVSSGTDPFVGLHLSLAEGWHVYWRNPGDTGLPPRIDIDATGYDVGPITWPSPTVFEEADGLFTTFGYSDQVLLSMPLTRKSDATASRSPDTLIDAEGIPAEWIHAEAHLLICKTECVPATFSLSTPIDPDITDDDQKRIDRLFAESRASAPISIDDLGLIAHAGWQATAPGPDEAASLSLTVATCPPGVEPCNASIARDSVVPFLPFEGLPFEFTNHRIVFGSEDHQTQVIEMEAERVDAGDDRLRGLVVLEDSHGRPLHVAIDVPIADAKLEQAVPPMSTSFGGWIQIFALALLGGLILNAMPCVLPVLAIKVVAIADLADKSPRHVRVQGLAYTGGVLASMAALAATVVLLRRAGHSVGWGFQFQEPLFVAVISAVLVTFAMNLFGVFEIDFGQGRLAQVGQAGSETRRSTFEGLLAVVLATPCTAPFLGTAVGFAFAASDLTIAMIFLAIGTGLALPFLAVSFVPGLARFIPRSGPWMLKLRVGLGFSLLATVVWLLWIVGQGGGAEAVIGLVAILLALAFLLWGFGQAQPLGSPWLARIAAVSIAAIALAGFNLIEFDSAPAGKTHVSAELESRWTPYSESAVAAALSEGRPAFVVFTADWCITCKLNEKTVLDSEPILNDLALGDHALFKADWTRRDESIRAKLAEFGRAGVPLYLVYSPDAPNDPEVLSELLSRGEVQTALARSAGRPRG
jgi:thiol:disulfide interchange protein